MMRSKVPAGLLLLAAVPTGAGLVRLVELAQSPVMTVENARFVTAPLPITVHIAGATIFAVVGAAQFSPVLRRRGWHRRTGRLVLPAGIVAATSGVWLSVFSDLPAHDGELLQLFRIGFGLAMLGSLVRGAHAISLRDVATHRAWMSRAYAIGLGAGTQAFTLGAWLAVRGEAVGATRAWLMFAGWAINLVVVEWHLARRPSGHPLAEREQSSNLSSVSP